MATMLKNRLTKNTVAAADLPTSLQSVLDSPHDQNNAHIGKSPTAALMTYEDVPRQPPAFAEMTKNGILTWHWSPPTSD